MNRREELDQERPPNCPNFGTMRRCGKSYHNKCRVGPCVEAHAKAVAQSKAANAAKKAAKAPLKNAVKPGQREFARDDHSSNPLWVKHGACCGGVWRRKSFGCLPKSPNSVSG